MATEPRTNPKGRWPTLFILLLVLPLVLGVVYFGVMLVLIPLLTEQPFDSADELTPENIKLLRVYFLNRPELDDGPDIGPYYAAPEDYAPLLAPLKAVPEVSDFEGTRGVWLGEYRVRLKSGRRGTIKLYWLKTTPDAVAKLRFQIGPHKFEGGTAAAVIKAAEDAAPRGRAP
jgi:hypothetical protein